MSRSLSAHPADRARRSGALRSFLAILIPYVSVLGLSVLAIAPPARAQFADPRLWVTDGNVYALALSGSTLYLGGQFAYVGPNTGSFVGLDATTGALSAGWPRVEGSVLAAVPDGAGGWYLGGRFQRVAGAPRNRLAHVRADGTMDAWNPGADSDVYALALNGSTLYVGGAFATLGGQARGRIGALDAGTGLATSWNPGADDEVLTLALSGSTIYAGGLFTKIGGQTRASIAALDATTGLATVWNPGTDGIVETITVNGSTTYAGGLFLNAGGQARNYIAALDATTGLATTWNPAASGSPGSIGVGAIAVSGSTIYVGGDFTSIGGQARGRIAALDATTALATAWNPGAAGFDGVTALLVSGSTVYAGGSFNSIGGQPRRSIAAIDAASGLATSWNPGLNGAVSALAKSGSSVYVSGQFSSTGGLARKDLAALDVASGSATVWNPGADDDVDALAVSGSTVYAGGFFSNAGGQARAKIAAIDAGTGLATAWNPGGSGVLEVLALAVSGSTVYAGGRFFTMGGQPRISLAALDATTGLATAWDPGIAPAGTPLVFALAVGDTTIYVGGNFPSIGGQTRPAIAEIGLATALATAWNPAPSGNGLAVRSFALSGSAVYVGGTFTSIGGQSRMQLAALDPVSGLATAWNPGAGPPNPSVNPFYNGVEALGLSGSTVYAGGSFLNAGGQPRSYVAGLDGTTALATAWNPAPDYDVRALVPSGSAVYAGGIFTTISGDFGAYGLARILPAPASPPVAAVLVPNGGEMINVGSTYRLSWSASTPDPGVESVDLYLSRSGAGGPWELIAAGVPNVSHYDWLVTGPTSTGNCFLRVDARDYAGTIGSDVSDAGFTITSGGLAVGPGGNAAFALEPVAPNPSRGRAQLSYVVPRESHVRLTLLDVQGRELAVMADATIEAGLHAVSLDAGALRPGLHFVRMQAPGVDLRQRFVVLR